MAPRWRLPRLVAPNALAAAFAWGPAVDLAEGFFRLGQRRESWGDLALALAAVLGRYAIACRALRRSRDEAAFALAWGSFALGVALQVPLLVQSGVYSWLANALFVPFLVSLYAALFATCLPRRSTGATPLESAGDRVRAIAWVAVPQFLLCLQGLWEFHWRLDTMGIGWWLRGSLGVIVPAALAIDLGHERRNPGDALRVNASRLLQGIAGAVLIPFAGAALIVFQFILSCFPVMNPFLVASARARDGTLAVLVQTPDDPYDVDLIVRAPGQPMARYRVAHDELLWPGHMAFDSRTQDLWITAWDMDVAVLRAGRARLEARRPLWCFSPDPY